MNSLTLSKEGPVFVVTMNDGKTANTFTAAVIEEHLAVLDEIESSTDNGAVVLTSNDPKFWSNGINLEWLLTQPSDYIPVFKDLMDKMLLRWATLSMPTIACLTGHAFGGGAILSCAFDFRLMRQDRGFFCFPEVDIKIPFTDVMHHVIANLPDRQALNELALTGRRVGGEEAKQLKIVSGSYPQEELTTKTMELAQLLAQKDRATFTSIKKGLRKSLFELKGKK